MSLVEKALKKMQQAQRGTADKPSQPALPATNNVASSRASEGVFGSVVTTGTYRVAVSDAAAPPSTPAMPATNSAAQSQRIELPVGDRLVAIDQAALRLAGLLPPEHQERQLSQQYRQIKRPLIANAMGQNGNPPLPNGHLIMMASAVPGEGKTFTSLNLAFSMALEKDIRVLLVDADIPKPHISRLLGVDGEPGLQDALKDRKLDVESLILPTNVDNLFVLPAGRRTANATELLASDRMGEIAKLIGERDPQRIVLFDSPPLLLTTESQALAQVAGQIVVVVRADVTPQQVVIDALSYLAEEKSVSLILNQSVTESSTGYYYYGYGDQAHHSAGKPD